MRKGAGFPWVLAIFLLLSALLHGALLLLPLGRAGGTAQGSAETVYLLGAGGTARRLAAGAKRAETKDAADARRRTPAAPHRHHRERHREGSKRHHSGRTHRQRRKLARPPHPRHLTPPRQRPQPERLPAPPKAPAPPAPRPAPQKKAPRQRPKSPLLLQPPAGGRSADKAPSAPAPDRPASARAPSLPHPGRRGKRGQGGASGAAPAAAARGKGGGPVTARFGTRNGPGILHLVRPVYPLLARRLRKEGRVVLRLHLDVRGIVTRAEVVHSAGFGFDQAALQAARRSRFRPARRNGVPVPCLALLPFDFRLHRP